MSFKFKNIHLPKAGMLNNVLSEEDKMSITHFKISGFINREDFDILDDMCTSWVDIDDEDNNNINFDEPPYLQWLDLGECELTDATYLPEFTYYPKLEKIIFPKNLESTSDFWVFETADMLRKVVAPESLKEFGSGTFVSCTMLEEINFPSQLERIGAYAFSGCTNLKNVRIPQFVSIIEESAFMRCTKLRMFDLDEENQFFKVIDGVLFTKDFTTLVAFPCGYKDQRYEIPEGVKVIGPGAFGGAQITSVGFPESLEMIGDSAFRGCLQLESVVIPESVVALGSCAFHGCRSLHHVVLPGRLSALKEHTFSACYSLKEIAIPPSVTTIDKSTFEFSENIRTISV